MPFRRNLKSGHAETDSWLRGSMPYSRKYIFLFNLSFKMPGDIFNLNKWENVLKYLKSPFKIRFQKEKKNPWVGLEPRAEIEKYFVHFFVQMKPAKSPFEIIWPFKFKAEGREFAKILRSLEQFIQTVKGQNIFW